MWPRPRPDSWGTATPQAATSGASGRVILSPTPPVECLSAVGRDSVEKSIRSPDAIIASVQRAISRRSMPLSRIAIASADICSSATVAAGVGVDDPVDLAVAELAPVALGDDDLDGVVCGHQGVPPVAVSGGRRGRRRRAAPRPWCGRPRRSRSAGRRPPCSKSSWRHRPQGMITSPSPLTHTKCVSRPPPVACSEETSPHSAHSVTPYAAFSTLQPTTSRPSSTSAAAPTG